MIVTVTLPANKTTAKFGKSELLADDNGHMDVPAYVAKLLVVGAGCTCPSDLSGSIGSMLDALGPDEKFEANYVFWAHGKPLPAIDEDIIVAAGNVLADLGNPSVSVS